MLLLYRPLFLVIFLFNIEVLRVFYPFPPIVNLETRLVIVNLPELVSPWAIIKQSLRSIK